MYTTILYEKKEGLATITLHRPKRYNAFIKAMNDELTHAFEQAEQDDEIRVVVLTGGDGKAFCAGQDLKSIGDVAGTRNLGKSVEQRYNPMIKKMHSLAKPIICRLNGVAAGAGCSLALACDMIVASEKATMIEAFIKIGLVLDSGSSYFLPRAVGIKKAFELATMGNLITAQEALQLGLVNKVVPHNELDVAVKEITDYFVQAPTKAVGLIKRMLYMSSQASLDTMLQQEAYCQEIAGFSNDYVEGVSAFIEKRKANFTGA